MRVPLSWLREFTDVQLTPEQLADALTLRGLEVRGVERWGSHWEKIVVGELLEVGPHPRADRLQLTRVRVGADEVLNVVCGARNIAVGQRVPVALVGAQMLDGRRIERAEKMGVASEGMLCSGNELDATDDGEGILILDAKAPIGTRLVDWIGDDVIDVDVKPNRGDLLSILGLAREVAAITGAPLRTIKRALRESGQEVGDGLALEVADAALAPRVVLRVVDGVNVAPSPDPVQMRLKAAGMRSVSNVVDATNYIMLELGKPTHAFDRRAVGSRIVIRKAERGERLETLDHVTRDLDTDDLVVADERGALALAGVMGGALSEELPCDTHRIVCSVEPGELRRVALGERLMKVREVSDELRWLRPIVSKQSTSHPTTDHDSRGFIKSDHLGCDRGAEGAIEARFTSAIGVRGACAGHPYHVFIVLMAKAIVPVAVATLEITEWPDLVARPTRAQPLDVIKKLLPDHRVA